MVVLWSGVGAREKYTVYAYVFQISAKLSNIHVAAPALLKASYSLALLFSHIVVPFCSSCYLKNFMRSVGEALYDPLLQLSLRFDFDMSLYAGVSVRACLHVHVQFSMARLNYLRPVPLLPGFMAYSSIPIGYSLDAPTSNS